MRLKQCPERGYEESCAEKGAAGLPDMCPGSDLLTALNRATANATAASGYSGLLRCYISRVGNGHTVPAIETLEKMARALEVPLYQLPRRRAA